MITSAFISKLRREYNDLPIKHRDVSTSDGSSTVYRSKYFPIKEGSYSMYVNNALKSEGVSGDYTLDKDTGDIVLAAAATSTHEIRLQYQGVKWRDQNWLEAIQSSFYAMGDEFYKSVIRSTSSMAISAGVTVANCPSSCIRLIEALESSDYTLSGSWVDINTNKRYDRRSNKLICGVKPSRSNYLAISFLRKLTPPSGVGSVLDTEDNWLELHKLKSGSMFLRSMANKIAMQGNATTEEGFYSMGQLRQLANDDEIKYENLKKKLKPVMPHSVIPYYIHGGGNV